MKAYKKKDSVKSNKQNPQWANTTKEREEKKKKHAFYPLLSVKLHWGRVFLFFLTRFLNPRLCRSHFFPFPLLGSKACEKEERSKWNHMAFADTPAASASSRWGATWTWPAAEVRNALQGRTPLSTLARCWRAAQCFAAVAAPPPSWRAPRPAKSGVTAKSHRNHLGWWWRWWAEGPQLGIRFARDSMMTRLAEQVASKTGSL